MQLRHAPVVEHLAATHRIAEMYLPVITRVSIGQGRRNPPFRHDRMGFSQQGLTDQADRHPMGRRLDCSTQPGAASADDNDIMFMRFVSVH
jgi:hypothetical protein